MTAATPSSSSTAAHTARSNRGRLDLIDEARRKGGYPAAVTNLLTHAVKA